MRKCSNCPELLKRNRKPYCADKEQVRAPRLLRKFPIVPEWCEKKEPEVTSDTNFIKASD